MRRSSLKECGLAVDREAVWAAFSPFVLPETADNDRVWREGVRKRRFRILKVLGRKLLGIKEKVPERTTEFIKNSYGPKWAEIGYVNYDTEKQQSNYTPWLWDGRPIMASTYGSARYRHLLIAAVIEKLKPRSVLEVGCGNGINLMLLANRFPDITFAGIDLTDSGPRQFKEMQARGSLTNNLLAYAPLPPRDPKGYLKVDMRQGSAESIDFADGSFDLVYSVLALEQMEHIRRRALSEMARVSGQWALMIEPFRDVNPYLWPRLNVVRLDYFQGRICELPAVGLEPVFATDDFPQEALLRACMTLSRKTDADSKAAETLAAQ
jgi:SAM-dependent methyltransferase